MPARRFSSILLLAAVLAAPALAGGGALRPASSQPVTGVVELFTSQGCSACPAAAERIARLGQAEGILTLSYHVDYWDYIGWQDRFGSRENTQRQRAYAAAFGSHSIYTPQAVVNGQRAMIASQEGKIRQALAETALDEDRIEAQVRLALQADRLHIAADAKGPAPAGASPVLLLVTYQERAVTHVTSGENAGQALVSHAPVQKVQVIGMWSGQPLEADLPLSTLLPPGKAGHKRIGCAALLQATHPNGTPGPILAAAAILIQ